MTERGRMSATHSNRVSPLAPYGRLEPIGSPRRLRWNADPLPGESLKRLVIRDIDPSPSSERAFAPNRIAESFAELHGVFDTGSGRSRSIPNAYSVITPAGDAAIPGSITPSGTRSGSRSR